MRDAEAVLEFWFREIDKHYWWKKDAEFDRLIGSRFAAVHASAVQAEYFTWRSTSRGRLAEIIVLDQFSRNLFRSQERAFAADPMALVLAQEAVQGNAGDSLSPAEKSFLYMPYMHSESRLIHAEAVKLFSEPGQEANLKFELRHKAIIDEFGRYPHRNEALGRQSTARELEFLKTPGSGF